MMGASSSGLIGGRYRASAGTALAAGASGRVVSAVDERTGDEVALKLVHIEGVDDKARARFEAEARAVARLDHPHVVRMLDAGVDADANTAYLAFELLRGSDLASYLSAAEAPLAWRAGASLLAQVADALAAAHAAGVLHRDLSPRNVFVVDGAADAAGAPFVKLLDFGLARILDGDATGAPRTTTGVVWGTPGYLAPERLTGKGEDERSDLYALGALAWQALAKRGPFIAASQPLLSIKHLTEKAPSLLLTVDVPDELALLVTALLEKEPARRYQHAEHVRDRLLALASS